MRFSVPLDKARDHYSQKTFCENCKKDRKIFCYLCEKNLLPEEDIPKIALPVDLVILKHPKEKITKSSA